MFEIIVQNKVVQQTMRSKSHVVRKKYVDTFIRAHIRVWKCRIPAVFTRIPCINYHVCGPCQYFTFPGGLGVQSSEGTCQARETVSCVCYKDSEYSLILKCVPWAAVGLMLCQHHRWSTSSKSTSSLSCLLVAQDIHRGLDLWWVNRQKRQSHIKSTLVQWLLLTLTRV